MRQIAKLIWVALLPTVLISLCTGCNEITAEAPEQTLSPREANVLEETYKNTRATILNDTLGFEDTREFWFSIDTLKKYIAYVEQEGAKMNKTGLGLRVYFGAYPQDGNYPNPGFSTVFFVPTAKATNTTAVKGFAPMQSNDENLDGLQALNYGSGGIPPNDYEGEE